MEDESASKRRWSKRTQTLEMRGQNARGDIPAQRNVRGVGQFEQGHDLDAALVALV